MLRWLVFLTKKASIASMCHCSPKLAIIHLRTPNRVHITSGWGKELSPRRRLFLLDSLIVLHLARVIAIVVTDVSGQRDSAQIILAVVSGLSRILLRWEISPHSSNMV